MTIQATFDLVAHAAFAYNAASGGYTYMYPLPPALGSGQYLAGAVVVEDDEQGTLTLRCTYTGTNTRANYNNCTHVSMLFGIRPRNSDYVIVPGSNYPSIISTWELVDIAAQASGSTYPQLVASHSTAGLARVSLGYVPAMLGYAVPNALNIWASYDTGNSSAIGGGLMVRDTTQTSAAGGAGTSTRTMVISMRGSLKEYTEELAEYASPTVTDTATVQAGRTDRTYHHLEKLATDRARVRVSEDHVIDQYKATSTVQAKARHYTINTPTGDSFTVFGVPYTQSTLVLPSTPEWSAHQTSEYMRALALGNSLWDRLN